MTIYQAQNRTGKHVAYLLGALAFSATMGAFAETTPAPANEFATHAELGLMQGFPPSEEKRVDRSNALFGVPYNRWSYQNMRSLLPHGQYSDSQSAGDHQQKD
jgi:hypothetical protein